MSFKDLEVAFNFKSPEEVVKEAKETVTKTAKKPVCLSFQKPKPKPRCEVAAKDSDMDEKEPPNIPYKRPHPIVLNSTTKKETPKEEKNSKAKASKAKVSKDEKKSKAKAK